MLLRSTALSAAALLLAGLLSPARGADFDMTITLDNFDFSDAIAGEVKEGALKDRVVLVQLWGVR